jgi:hypothetical protein
LTELESDIIKLTEKKLTETIYYKNCDYDRTNLKSNRTNFNDFKSLDTNLKTSYDDLMSSKGIYILIRNVI